MPAGPSGQSGRGTSYASVVAGTNNGHTQSPDSYPRPNSFSHILNPQNDYRHDNQSPNQRRENRQEPFLGHWDSTGTSSLPSYSRAFAGLIRGPSGYSIPDNAFLAPSYLKDSAYLQKLRKTAQTKPLSTSIFVTSGVDAPPASNPHSADVSSHVRLGVVHDVLERVSPSALNDLTPLPSKWNVNDKWDGLDVFADGLEVKYTGARSEGRDHEAFSIRADNPMPPQAGIYYYEVTILSRKRDDSSVAIGFSGKDVSLSRPPGWEPDSWAYHGDDGHTFACQSSGRHYGPEFSTGDVIGCGINFRTGNAFFTRNGENLGIAFRDIKGKLFPSIGLRRAGEHIRVNFGQKPFVFDIDSMMRVEIEAIHSQVRKTSTSKLSHPFADETSFIQKLVLNYLVHDGYVETAQAFAEEITSERQALHIDKKTPLSASDTIVVKEDADAVHRQRIRAAIMDGDIDTAVLAIRKQYPDVLTQNKHLDFAIKCRKFIELICTAAESQVDVKADSFFTASGKWQGKASTSIQDHVKMDIDDNSSLANGDNMSASFERQDLLQRAIDYGTELAAEFEGDSDRVIHRRLEEVFSLIAYTDPLHDNAVSDLVDKSGRLRIAEEINSAILVSLGKSSCASLERLIQQISVLNEDLSEDGGSGAMVNLDAYLRPSHLDELS